jgi:hypothetical protein
MSHHYISYLPSVNHFLDSAEALVYNILYLYLKEKTWKDINIQLDNLKKL